MVERMDHDVLFRARHEAIIADRLAAGLRVGPRRRRVEAPHPDPRVMRRDGRGIFDVVAHVEHIVDAGAEHFVEMAAVVDAPADPGDGERARQRTARWHIGPEQHRRGVENVGPAAE